MKLLNDFSHALHTQPPAAKIILELYKSEVA